MLCHAFPHLVSLYEQSVNLNDNKNIGYVDQKNNRYYKETKK